MILNEKNLHQIMNLQLKLFQLLVSYNVELDKMQIVQNILVHIHDTTHYVHKQINELLFQTNHSSNINIYLSDLTFHLKTYCKKVSENVNYIYIYIY